MFKLHIADWQCDARQEVGYTSVAVRLSDWRTRVCVWIVSFIVCHMLTYRHQVHEWGLPDAITIDIVYGAKKVAFIADHAQSLQS